MIRTRRWLPYGTQNIPEQDVATNDSATGLYSFATRVFALRNCGLSECLPPSQFFSNWV